MKTREYRLLISLVGAVVLALGGCARPETPGPELPVIAKEPGWSLKDLNGHEVGAASLRGKVVVVDFWATWCGPCVGEIPNYVALQKKYAAKGLVVVGLSVDAGGPAVVRDFAEKHGMNYTLAMADEATVAAFGNFEAIPTTFLIDRAGNIRHQKTGAMEAAAYEKLVQSVIE